MQHETKHAADAIEIELIRSLYDGFLPSVIMSVGFVLSGMMIVWRTGDPILEALLLPGLVASILRLFVVWRDGKEAVDPRLKIAAARRLERRFAVTYHAFALALGLFGTRVFWLPSHGAGAHLLMLALLIGYAAGVAAGIGLRPRIAIPSMVIAVAPPLVAIVASIKPLYAATAVMTCAFLVGGVFSLRKRHARALVDIGRRLTFASLARQDNLTALPNRLALRESYDEAESATDGARLVALHCLDLNGFKPVNDRFGHPTGDALLAAVAKRLEGAIRESDIAARLGGDEFAIVQRDIAHPDEARLFAQRIVAAIGRPYRIGEHTLHISTCVGYVVADDSTRDLEQLISLADEALYSAKRNGIGVKRYEPPAGERAAA
ncbi:diguanylate cyclase (GGDEF)-like protein [Sphingopyxis panaciterrae]|uniref:GGDEF domain-containing protein n=1 Tax=Sphingopyxis panaciterrae TaxID=363841 RepID=UPI001420878C|nr:diguanylate cyclase [Sphingopyxis panaciterrae]NIJ35520.1 diguanylate cyclase (GGDEF)-like protein [Sphingopyxis panaciterrae]